MGLGHNDPWLESHIRPQQMWGQRFQVFAKTVTVSTYFHVCSGETRGSRTTCGELYSQIIILNITKKCRCPDLNL